MKEITQKLVKTKHSLSIIVMVTMMLASYTVKAQVAINTDGSVADSSAILDVKSDTTGLLIPRMTQKQRDAISNPATGLLVYQTTELVGYYYFTGSDWIGLMNIGSGGIPISGLIDCDGNTYPTITIGKQVWMAENLKVTHYRNGDAIPNETKSKTWAGLSTGAYCWYDNYKTTNKKFGALYNWYAVDDSRGLCPEGWHVPTHVEWTTLTTYLGGTIAGGKMKTTSKFWTSPNTDATNSTGFTGLPGGGRSNGGTFGDVGDVGYWWSSTERSSSSVWYHGLGYSDGSLSVGNGSKRLGFSVRCLRDN